MSFDYHNKDLDQLCTKYQLNILESYRKTASSYVTAEELGVSSASAVRSALKKIRKNANKHLSELHDATVNPVIPEGYHVKGASSAVRNADGLITWIKTDIDKVKQIEQAEIAIKSLCDDLPKINASEYEQGESDIDLIPWFQIGDAHLGMLAHDKEVGHNFDLKIAERELCAAMIMLISRAPKTDRCVIQDLGDFSHYENYEGITSASGHALDCDTRFHKMITVYARTMRFIVTTALKKYKYVDVIINQGNHSRTNDHWIAIMLRTIYENEPRLHVLENESIFIPYRMGNTFVMSHHSDKCKGVKLAGVMANDFAQDWGETKYHYIDVGHVHHKQIAKEENGAIIESWNQLAPMDKYAHDGGWRSRQFLTVVLRSKTYGEKGRITITGEEVKDRLMRAEPGAECIKRREVYTV